MMDFTKNPLVFWKADFELSASAYKWTERRESKLQNAMIKSFGISWCIKFWTQKHDQTPIHVKSFT